MDSTCSDTFSPRPRYHDEILYSGHHSHYNFDGKIEMRIEDVDIRRYDTAEMIQDFLVFSVILYSFITQKIGFY